MRVNLFYFISSTIIIIVKTSVSPISGSFQVRLQSFESLENKKSSDLWRICLTNFQSNPIDGFDCKLSKEVHVDSSVLETGVDLPFDFVWPGSFSLFIQSWVGPVPMSPIFSNIMVFDTGFAKLNAKAGKNWTTVKLSDTKLRSTVTIEYRIVCADGFFGDYCERSCTLKGGNVVCSSNGTLICATGWTGKKCDQAVCKGCAKNGRCIKPGICQCDLGWTGSNCDQCSTKPNCKHGTCQKPNECNCDRGWGGQLCDIDLEYCTRHKPCKNSASCNNGGPGNYTSYTCNCLPGYAGKNCEIKLDGCPVKPFGLQKVSGRCQNGGLCLQSSSKNYYCKCSHGFSGAFCEHLVNYCENKCQNGGECVFNDLFGNYSCECLAGYSGAYCEHKITVCELQNPCMNGGFCEAMPSGFLCKCLTGFWGHFCEFSVDPCEGVVCENGGKCIAATDGQYQCQCSVGFTGKNCDIKEIGCEQMRCGNGSTCISTTVGHRCLCGPCYAGPDCRLVDQQCLIKMAGNWNSLSEPFLIVIAVLTFLILVTLVIFLFWKCHLRRSTAIDPVTENMINAHKIRLYQLPNVNFKIGNNDCDVPEHKYKPVPVSQLKRFTKYNEYCEHQKDSSMSIDKLNLGSHRSSSIGDQQGDEALYAEVDGPDYASNFPLPFDEVTAQVTSELKILNSYNCDRGSRYSSKCIDVHTNV